MGGEEAAVVCLEARIADGGDVRREGDEQVVLLLSTVLEADCVRLDALDPPAGVAPDRSRLELLRDDGVSFGPNAAMYEGSYVAQTIRNASRASWRRSQVSTISTSSYRGPAHLLFGGTRKRIVRSRSPRVASRRRSRAPSEAIAAGSQIVSACSARPGTSPGRMAAPVASTR